MNNTEYECSNAEQSFSCAIMSDPKGIPSDCVLWKTKRCNPGHCSQTDKQLAQTLTEDTQGLRSFPSKSARPCLLLIKNTILCFTKKGILCYKLEIVHSCIYMQTNVDHKLVKLQSWLVHRGLSISQCWGRLTTYSMSPHGKGQRREMCSCYDEPHSN